MFDIYIKDYNDANGQLVNTETLVQTIPASSEGELKLLNPSVKAEMGNAESFNFAIEAGTKFYDAFNQMKTFMRVVYDGDTIFYGRILTIDNDFYGNRKLRCEGPLAFLNDSSLEGTKEESRTEISVKEYLEQILNNHNTMVADAKRSFIVGETPGNYTSLVNSAQKIKNETRRFGNDSWQDSKAAIEDLRSHYGGYLRIRCTGHKSGNAFIDEGHYFDWMDHYFNKDQITQTIEIGKNVIDLSTSTEIDNIFTVVIPIGNRSTNSSSETVDGEKKSTGPKHFYVPGKEVTVPSICSENGGPYSQADLDSGYHFYDDYKYALQKYGRVIKTVVLDDAKEPADLLTKCQEWIKNNYQGEVTKFTVKAVDMHQIGDQSISKIMVGDRVKIIYPVYKEDGSIEKKTIVRTCLSINFDLYNPENNSYTFGIPANILTKSYGVLKQGKSTKDGETKPKSSPSSGSINDRSWLDKVREWLASHHVYYKHLSNGIDEDSTVVNDPQLWPHPKPPADGELYRAHEKSPNGYSERAGRFYSSEIIGGGGYFNIWKFIPQGQGDDFKQEELDALLQQVEQGMQNAPSTAIEQAKIGTEKAYRQSCIYTKWGLEHLMFEGVLSHQQIIECNIIPFVKQEYGINLDNFENTKMPEITFRDSSTGDTRRVAANDGTVVTLEMFNNDYQHDPSRNDGFHIINQSDGRRIVSILDGDPNDPDNPVHWVYWEVDPDHPGNLVQTSVRKLTFETRDLSNFKGNIVRDGYADEDGNFYIYKFGTEIENWYGGEMVVQHVDGDVIKIGGRKTQYSTSVAHKINGNWLGSIEYVLEDVDGVRHAILVGKTGQASMRARKDPTTGEYVYDPDGEYEITGDGLWDTSNLALKGGILTVEEGGRPVTYVKSSQLIVGNTNTGNTIKQALLDAGLFYKHVDGQADTLITDMADLDAWLDADKAIVTPVLVAKRIYTDELNAVRARIGTIEADYITANNIEAKWANFSRLTVPNIYGLSEGNSTCTFGTYYSASNAYYLTFSAGTFGPSPTQRNLADSIWAVKLFQNGSEYKLKSYNCKQNPDADESGTSSIGTVIGTFSRAISSFSGAWDGNKFTVTASPQDQEYSIFVQSATNTGVYYSGDLPHWGTGTSKTWRIIPLMWYEPSLGTPYAYQTPYNVSLDVSSLINRISSDGIIDTASEQPVKEELSIAAYNSSDTELKSDDYKLVLTTRRIGTTSSQECVNLVRKTNDFVVGRIDVHSVYESGHTDGLNDETINLIANDSTAPAYNAEQKTITIKATTTHGYKSKTRDVALAVGTYQYSSTTSHDCVNLFLDNSTTGSIIGRIDVDSIYTKGLNAETITSIVNNTTAPAYNAELKTITIKATTTHGAKTKTRDVALSLTKYQYSSTTQHDCVNLCLDSSSGSVIGRIDINSVYTSGRTSGWNSCYSSLSTNSSPSSKTLSYGGSAYVLITQTDSSGTSQTRFTATYTAPTDSNLVAGNIKSGVTIFGVTGTYSGGSPTILASAQGSQSDANASAVSAFCDGATKLFDTTSYHVRNGYWYKIKITAGSSEKYYVFHAYA